MQTYIWNTCMSIYVVYIDFVNVGSYETTTMQTIAWGVCCAVIYFYCGAVN